MEWTPIKHEIVKNNNSKEILHNLGYLIDGNIGQENILKIKKVFEKYHKVKSKNGGMFYSLYSLDLKYRNNVHQDLGEILLPFFEEKFQNYRSVINSFIVKFNGEESAFTLHQDSTSLDEEKFSPLSIWIPLQDTSLENGCLCVIPKSHKFFYPYRGISFQSPFSKIEKTLKEYLLPIEMKAGDILIFDNRLVHFSPENNSNKPRIVAMSGLFPEAAAILNCYKDEQIENAPLEIYEQDNHFLLNNVNFYHDCTKRPVLGKKIKEIAVQLPEFNEEKFLKKAKDYGIEKVNNPKIVNSNPNIKIISEPTEKDNSIRNFFSKLIN